MPELQNPANQSMSIVRVCALMFFQVFVFGTFNPILTSYFTNDLGFSTFQTGVILALSVISNLISPLLSVYIIDRRIRARGLFIILHGILGLANIGLFFVRRFEVVAMIYVLNTLCTGPALGILSAMTFQTLKDRHGNGKNYGFIRVWGTLGWMAAGGTMTALGFLLPGILGVPSTTSFLNWAFLLAAVGSLACVILTLGTPKGQIQTISKREFIPRESLAVMIQPSIIILAIVFLLSSILDKFFWFGTHPFLAQLGFEGAAVQSLMLVGQVTEIVMLFGLSFLLRRFSLKTILMIGVISQIIRFALYQTASPTLALVGVAMNGLIFACIYSAITMYIDQHSTNTSRQGVHQLIQLFIGGSANLIGNLLAGKLTELFSTGINFSLLWLVALIGSGLNLLVLFFFKENPPIKESPNLSKE